MGIVKKPNVKSYWEKDSNLFSSIGICELFSRQRFCDIYSNLCLRNPLDKPAYEKDLLYKISPFINCIIESSRRYFTPDQQVTIDDAMIAFKGKNKLIQFMPLKPIRYGFKAFLLCDAMTGYVLKWKLYTKNPKDVDEDYGLTYKIMRILCKEIEGNYNIVFTDRYYTGLQILSDLRRLKIGACGTIKSDRTQLPKEFKDLANSLAQDETMYFKTGNNLLLSCWKDSALVTVCSNCFSTGNKIRTRRRKKKEIEKDEEERKTEVSREMNDSVDELEADLSEIEIYEDANIPPAIEQYNLYMHGVDRFDQKAAYYGLKLKSNRWYVKIFFHFIEISMINSYILYQKTCEKANISPISHLDFRKEVARSLVEDLRLESGIKPSKLKKGNSLNSLKTERLDSLPNIIPLKRCKIEKIPPNPLRKTNRYTCEIHDESDDDDEKKRAQTSFWCKSCKIPVCRKICFDKHCQ